MASLVVSQRQRELAMRMALGAGRREVLRASLGRAFRLLAIGSVAGLALGVMGARVLCHLAYQTTVQGSDGAGGVTLAMMLPGTTAALVPARRSPAANPMMLPRDE